MGEQGFVVCCSGGEERAHQAHRAASSKFGNSDVGSSCCSCRIITKNAGEYLNKASHINHWFVKREIRKMPGRTVKYSAISLSCTSKLVDTQRALSPSET